MGINPGFASLLSSQLSHSDDFTDLEFHATGPYVSATPGAALKSPSVEAAGGGDEGMQFSGEDCDMGLDADETSRNRRHRTMRQQMLNKQAQQRYRCLPLISLTCCHF